MPARPPVKPISAQPQSLGDEAQKIRDRLDGVPDNPITNLIQPQGEDNEVAPQSSNGPPLIDPGTYHTYGLK